MLCYTISMCLRILATSRILGHALRRYRKPFSSDDIRLKADVLDVSCEVEDLAGMRYNYVLHKPRETISVREDKKGKHRGQVHDTLERSGFAEEKPPTATGEEPRGRPLVVLFSTNRAVPSEKASSKSAAAEGVKGAFSSALSSRELRLGEFAA